MMLLLLPMRARALLRCSWMALAATLLLLPVLLPLSMVMLLLPVLLLRFSWAARAAPMPLPTPPMLPMLLLLRCCSYREAGASRRP